MAALVADPIWLVIVASMVGVVITALFGIFAGSDGRSRVGRSFKSAVSAGMKAKTLEWSDVGQLALRWKISRREIHLTFAELLSEALSSSDEQERALLPQIREFISAHERTEPYAELPESIRIRLNELASRFRENGLDAVAPLATSITDVVVKAEKLHASQTRTTRWSFAVGLFSLILGIASLVFAVMQMRAPTETNPPPTMQSAPRAQPTQQRGVP